MQTADAYRGEVETAGATFADFVPFRWDNPKRDTRGSAEQRQATAQGVAQMLECERTAISAIQEAVMVCSVNRDEHRVWIEGVEGFSPGKYASSPHGCQARILQTLGEQISYDDLICHSGFAFRVGAHEQMCPSAGHPCCGFMCMAGSNRALPWKVRLFESFQWSEPKDDRAAVAAIEKVLESLK